MRRTLTSANSASAASSAVVSLGAQSARTARSLPPRVPPAEEGSIASESLDSPRDTSVADASVQDRRVIAISPVTKPWSKKESFAHATLPTGRLGDGV